MILLLSVVMMMGCRQSRYLRPLADLEQVEAAAVGYRQKITELSAQIRTYEEGLSRLAGQRGQLAVLQKLLALEYLDRGMYADALAALQEARAIDTENPVLFYFTGVAAARLAKNTLARSTRDHFFADAEWSYRRALALDPAYAEALYALSVLLVLELGRPLEAETLLLRLLERQQRHFGGMFIQAAMYVQTDRTNQALEVYQQIERLSPDSANRAQALANRQALERKAP